MSRKHTILLDISVRSDSESPKAYRWSQYLNRYVNVNRKPARNRSGFLCYRVGSVEKIAEVIHRLDFLR